MNYRLAVIHALKSYDSDTVEVIDLNMVDPISHMVIELTTVFGSSVPTAHVLDCLTKIELIDGSDVLWNTNGRCAEGIDWYHSGGMQRRNYNYWLHNGAPTRTIVLNFGRYFWDTMLALNPTSFRNLQLRITLDIDAGGADVTPCKLRVWAGLFDQKDISPIGFIMTKEIKAYALTTGGTEYTDMPTDYKWIAMYLQSLLPGTETNQTIANIKISENMDKRIPYDCSGEDLMKTIELTTRPYQEMFWCATDNSNRTQYITPTTNVIAQCNEWNQSPGTGSISLYDGDGGSLKTKQLTAGQNVMINCAGYLPHALYHIPFGRLDDIGDYYDVRSINSVMAEIKAAAVTHTARILLQQLRNY